METSTEYCAEDKKCRICGLADICNINVFTSPKGIALMRKILAVYPIVIYKEDPLPKNICKKCINNVNFMYAEIQRVMRTQEKWTENVRRIQPCNDYVRIIKLIQESNNIALESIKTKFNVDIQRIPGEIIPKNSMHTNNITVEPPGTAVSNKRVEVNEPAFQEIQKSLGIYKLKSSTNSSPKIRELKTMLALNGCTLRPVNVDKSNAEEIRNRCNDDRASAGSESGNSEYEIPLAYCSSFPSKTIKNMESVKCRYCELKFESQSSLATHQILHVRLSIPRLCDKKYIEKKLRKGRVIIVEEQKRIRCLNCWRLFVNNKSILNHWLMGECEFYCHICGEEFPTSPKQLREHVPAAHGISYRTSKIRKTQQTKQNVLEPISEHRYKKATDVELWPCQDKKSSTQSQKKPQDSAITQAGITNTQTAKTIKKLKRQYPLDRFNSATCNICLRTFNNFKACNSHMRKHKPSYKYGDIVLSPHAHSDGYNNIDSLIPKTQIGNPISANRYKWPNSRERSATNFVTREVDMQTSTGVRIRSITEMQESPQPQKVVHPNVITAEATNSLSCWLSASNVAKLNSPLLESEVKEEPKDFDYN